MSEDTQGGLVVPVESGLLANDTGGSAVLCLVSIDTSNTQGAVDPGGVTDGSFTYLPPPDFNGSTTFTYEVATKTGDTCPTTSEGSALVTITVTPVNDPPFAVADFFSALTDRTLTIAAPGVLANDSDVDGDTLSAQKVSGGGPAHGTLILAADGGFSYTPKAGYTGPDAFAYRAFDGAAQSAARVVNITVSALPPSPSPTPLATPTPVPATATPEPSPTESPAPSDSGLASAIPEGPTPAPSTTASPAPVTGPASSSGGPPIVAIGALALLLGLLAVAAVYFVRSQRADGEVADGRGAPDVAFEDDLEEPLD